MLNLIFATNNKNKVREIQKMLDGYEIGSLESINSFEEIPETSPTLEGNALQKARFIHEKYGVDCFADDTGLEIEALNGEPGVYSARYAGPEKDSNNNMDLVLQNLKGNKNRSARFRTVIALILNGKEHIFEGEAKGEIINEKSGAEGFGYDPIFKPNGSQITFSEMTMEEKNKISHRGKATKKMVDYLNSL